MSASSHNPWTSIADLLSGAMVVFLLFFVTAALEPQLKKQSAADNEKAVQEQVMQDLKTTLGPFQDAGLVDVDVAHKMIAFKDASFPSASACLTTSASAAVDEIAVTIADQLTQHPNLTIQVEGHTDPSRVMNPPIRTCAGLSLTGGWFGDNTQLSTLRAANVRERLIVKAGDDARGRLPVTGWGPDRLRNTVDRFAAENRRVELIFVWRADADAPKAPPVAVVKDSPAQAGPSRTVQTSRAPTVPPKTAPVNVEGGSGSTP